MSNVMDSKQEQILYLTEEMNRVRQEFKDGAITAHQYRTIYEALHNQFYALTGSTAVC